MSLSIESLEFETEYVLVEGGNSEVFKDSIKNGMRFKLFEPHSKEPVRKGINDKSMCTIHLISDEVVSFRNYPKRYKTYFQKLHQEWIDRGTVKIKEKGE